MKKIFLVILICIFFISGCDVLKMPIENKANAQFEEQEDKGEEQKAEERKTDLKKNIDLSLKPNEAGKIMVLMYHNIGEEEKEWVRTPDNFIKDLNVLYEKGYRPISLKDYVSGNITTKQGFTPVVITFDDGNLNNFEYLENGEIKETSAVGLLLDFHEKHKDFPLEVTFFVNGEMPFRQNDSLHKKLDLIIESGMDIGNHTKDHNSFKNVSVDEIQRQIGAQAQSLESKINKENYKINTIALPFGERPKDESLNRFLKAGSYNGISYDNIAILNVGWHPAFSPYDQRFDQTSIPRIRASETKVDNVGLYNYIEYFDQHPEEKFISDGVAEVITVPENKIENLKVFNDKEVLTY